MNAAAAQVSILIPAYNERYFAEAFASALAQTFEAIEVVVCDDSPGPAIGEVVRAANDPRVRYVRNPARLGFGGNFTQCFTLARGEFVKFLNDDDRLRPRCVEVLAGMLGRDPTIALATSRRAVIGDHGEARPGIPATMPVSHVSALLPGIELGNFVLVNSMNFIGEPTTVLFRRSAIALEEGLLFRWGGRDYHCLADLSLWLRLLAKGPAYYDSSELSEYRMHAGQEQRRGGVELGCLVERLWIVRQSRGAGFLASPRLHRLALENVRARARQWMASLEPEGKEAGTLRGLVAEVDAELAALDSAARDG